MYNVLTCCPFCQKVLKRIAYNWRRLRQQPLQGKYS